MKTVIYVLGFVVIVLGLIWIYKYSPEARACVALGGHYDPYYHTGCFKDVRLP